MVFPLFYLLNAGHQFKSSNPPFGLCFFQAGLIYAGPPTGGAAVLAFIADVAFGLHSTLFRKTRNPKFATFLLLLPAAVFSVVFMISLLLVANPQSLQFDSAHMFCGAGAGAVQVKVSAGVFLIALLFILGLEGWIFFMLFRNWATVRSFRRSNTDLQLSMICRFSVLTVAIGLSATLGAVLLPENATVGGIWNIFLVSVPLFAGLAFGTQRDILIRIAHAFRKPHRPRVPGDFKASEA